MFFWILLLIGGLALAIYIVLKSCESKSDKFYEGAKDKVNQNASLNGTHYNVYITRVEQVTKEIRKGTFKRIHCFDIEVYSRKISDIKNKTSNTEYFVTSYCYEGLTLDRSDFERALFNKLSNYGLKSGDQFSVKCNCDSMARTFFGCTNKVY